jgi:hypothetical protein
VFVARCDLTGITHTQWECAVQQQRKAVPRPVLHAQQAAAERARSQSATTPGASATVTLDDIVFDDLGAQSTSSPSSTTSTSTASGVDNGLSEGVTIVALDDFESALASTVAPSSSQSASASSAAANVMHVEETWSLVASRDLNINVTQVSDWCF